MSARSRNAFYNRRTTNLSTPCSVSSRRNWLHSSGGAYEKGIAEDPAQEVMLIVYRKAGQPRDHKLFYAWLFKVARHATCRYFAQRTREVPTVDVADIGDSLPARIRVHSSLPENSRIG